LASESHGGHSAPVHLAGGQGEGNPLTAEHGSLVHPLAKLLHVPDWIVISGLIILLLALFARRTTRRMELVPTGWQNVGELVVDGLYTFVRSITGERGLKYAPFVGTLFIYIFLMNIMGVVPGMLAPTAKLSTTLALGLTTFVFVQFYAIRDTGVGAYLRHLCGEPIWLAPLMLPLHLVGELAKPLSLSIRLFGNVFGKDMVIINLVLLAATFPGFLKYVLPIQAPILAFGLFVGFVQALVFATLAAVYISLLTEHAGHEEGEH